MSLAGFFTYWYLGGVPSEVSGPYHMGRPCVLSPPGEGEGCIGYTAHPLGPLSILTSPERPKLLIEVGDRRLLGLVDVYVGPWGFVTGFALSKVMPLEAATRVCGALFAVAMFLAGAACARRFPGGGDPMQPLAVGGLACLGSAYLMGQAFGYQYEFVPMALTFALMADWLGAVKERRDLPLRWWLLMGLGVGMKATSLIFAVMVQGLWWLMGLRPRLKRPARQAAGLTLSLALGVPFLLMDPLLGHWWTHSAQGIVSGKVAPPPVEAGVVFQRFVLMLQQGFGAEPILRDFIGSPVDLPAVGWAFTALQAALLTLAWFRKGALSREVLGLWLGCGGFFAFTFWLYHEPFPPAQAAFPIFPALVLLMVQGMKGPSFKQWFAAAALGMVLLLGRMGFLLYHTQNPMWNRPAQLALADVVAGLPEGTPVVTTSFTQIGLLETHLERRRLSLKHAYHFFNHTQETSSIPRWRALSRQEPGAFVAIMESGVNPHICCQADAREILRGLGPAMAAEGRSVTRVASVKRLGVALFEVVRVQAKR